MADFDFPLAVQVEGMLMVFREPREFEFLIGAHRAALFEMGLVDLSLRMTAVEIPREGRFRVWIEWDHILPDGVWPGASTSIFYCRDVGTDSFRVEMVDFTRLTTGSPVISHQGADRRF